MENIQGNSAAFAPTLDVQAEKRVAPYNLQALKRQSNYRLAVGWVLLAIWGVSVWALDWDADWHTRVGRDGFWTPPHLVFYTTIAICGILCAGVVIVETLLFHRRTAGYNEQTTTPLLFVFHGPVGFMLSGFGMAVMLASAPLDDYWHRIYGVDVKVWAPFHVMLLIGIIMASLGLVYLFASEMVRRNSWRPVPTASKNLVSQVWLEVRDLFRSATLGLTLAMVFFVTRYLFLMGPDTVTRGTLQLGDLQLPAYSLVIAVLPIPLIALAGASGRFGIATLAGLFLLIYRLLSAPLIQWGVDYLVVEQGRTLRNNTNEVSWIWIYPIFLFLVGLLVDLAFLVTRRWRNSGARPLARELGIAVAVSTIGGVLLFLLDKPWEHINNITRRLIQESGNATVIASLDSFLFKPDYWAALPLVIGLAALAGIVGWAFAVSLRYTDR